MLTVMAALAAVLGPLADAPDCSKFPNASECRAGSGVGHTLVWIIPLVVVLAVIAAVVLLAVRVGRRRRPPAA